MSFFRDLAEFLLITGSEELKDGASLVGKTAVDTATVASEELLYKLDEKNEEHNKKVYEKNKDKQVGRLKASIWLGSNTNQFHKKDEKQLHEMLVKLTNEQFLNMTKHLKKPQTMILVSVLFGAFGVDRFLLSDIKMGVIKLMTFGGLLVLWIIDIFTTYSRTKTYNFNIINNILKQE